MSHVQLKAVVELTHRGYTLSEHHSPRSGGPTYLVSPTGQHVFVDATGIMHEMNDGAQKIPGENCGKTVIVQDGKIIGAQG